MRAAMLGGAGYMVGKRRAQASEQQSQEEAAQDQRIDQLESQQQGSQQAPTQQGYAQQPPQPQSQAYAQQPPQTPPQGYAQQQQPPAAPATEAPAAGGGTDIVSRLSELKGLADAGALTPQEFEQAKAKLLAGG